MSSMLITAGVAAAILSAGPALATEPANMQDRAPLAEEIGLAVDWDLSAGAGGFTAVVTDGSTGDVIADISDYVNHTSVTVADDGTVTID